MRGKYLPVRTKFWTLFVALSLAGLSIVLFVGFYLYEGLYLHSEAQQLEEHSEALKHAYEEYNEEELSLVEDWLSNSSISVAISDDPMTLGAALPLLEPEQHLIINEEERELLLNGESVRIERENAYLSTHLMGFAEPVMEEEELAAVILVYKPISEINQALLEVLPILLITAFAAVLLLFVLKQKIQKDYIDPVLNLEHSAKKVANGQYGTRVEVKTNNEVGDLGKSFNHLADSIQKEDEKKRQFLQNISHELRTPLSYIKGYSELTVSGTKDTEVPAIILHEANRMQRLVDQLIDLTQLEESSRMKMERMPLVLSEVVASAVKTTALKSREKKQHVHLELDESLLVYGNEDRLIQVLINVLDNAIAYTDEGGRITIRTFKEKKQAVLELTDSGIGIFEEDLPYITERLYRGEKGRTREKGGLGVGLSIVKQIIELHEGSLFLESAVGEGTTVTIYLPLYSDEGQP
ncbi:sensor histidine kinase [Alkalicoccus chagannorensis]|uniref:sensor histidine kinase n=1 Tax=Alkalicoccus chagannorensis TaxID=427072 RepID=UPI00047C8631|nr:ATP-binding protein [Alkalicoccus chagannorensis]